MAATANAEKTGDSALRRALLPAGLVLAIAGVFLALWAFTGKRSLELTYFWWALSGLALVIVGVAVAALGRALAPRGRAARKGPPPAMKPRAVPAAFPTARPQDTPAHALLRCPDCASTFPMPAGQGAISCPSCGAEGDRPAAPAPEGA